MTRGRPVEDHPLDVGFAQPRGERARRQDGAVPQLAHGTLEGLHTDEHVEQRSRTAAVCGSRAGSGRHLHQRVGSALRRRPLQLEHHRVPTQAATSLGPVRLEQLALQDRQRLVDDRARHRVERHPAEPHPLEALREVDLAASAARRRPGPRPRPGPRGWPTRRTPGGSGGTRACGPRRAAPCARRANASSVRGVRARSNVVRCVRSISPALQAAATSGRSRTARAWRIRWLVTPFGRWHRHPSHAAPDRAPSIDQQDSASQRASTRASAASSFAFSRWSSTTISLRTVAGTPSRSVAASSSIAAWSASNTCSIQPDSTKCVNAPRGSSW